MRVKGTAMPREVDDHAGVEIEQGSGNDSPAKQGLRERKHQATYRAIVTGALDIFEERGYEAVTVEAICQRAGVSKRTFFNYFSSKDAVLTGEGPTIIPDEELRAFLERYEPDTLTGVAAAIAQGERSSYHDLALEHRRHKVLSSDPILSWQHFRHGHEAGKAFYAVVVDFLTAHPSLRRIPDISVGEESRLIVMMAFLSVKQAGHHYCMTSDDKESTTALAECYEQAIDHMRAVLGDGSRKDAHANL